MKKLLVVITIFFSVCLFAQEQILISNGLAIKIDPPGRRSLSQVDPIEYKIVSGNWKEPKENELMKLDTTESQWFSVNANNNGWFTGSELRGSYIYYKYNSDKEKIMVLEGYNYYNVFINQEPRIGNIYGNKENFEIWEPNFNYSFLPVKIKKGKNEFLFQVTNGNMKAVLHEISSEAFFNLRDNTLPDIFKNNPYNDFGGIIIVNAQEKPLKNAIIKVTNHDGIETVTEVPQIIPISIRKVKFDFKGNAKNEDKELLKIQLIVDGKVTDEQQISLKCVNKLDAYKQTFISALDGSVQYYAVRPSKNTNSEEKQALFLSVHGASVEAINQAGSYSNKEWGNIVCPTNRRPYGFNWEDIGRYDALEVLNIAKQKFSVDEERVYLTGHSMGGHGTWYLGANYPDQFGAIGPSAGWISLWSYRSNNKKESANKTWELYNRAAQQSDTYSLAHNYSDLGIYVLHGEADSIVSPFQAKSMLRTLSTFHKDFDSHFEPGVEHWWDVDAEKPGSDCVDWTPMFDFFARHARPLNRIKKLSFTTATPGIASKNYWVTIEQQEKQFEFSNIQIEFVPEVNIFRTQTSNIKTFSVDAESLGLKQNDQITFEINDNKIAGTISGNKVYLTKEGEIWKFKYEINLAEKNPKRYGSFKDLFRDNLVLVYGTNGTKEENEQILAKVRYDSEMFWYVGNGSFEIISDKEFKSENYSANNILFYGNIEQNNAYKTLLNNSPIIIDDNKIEIENKKIEGDNLACYFVYPKHGNNNNLIGVIAGTGNYGMKLTYMRPFLKPGASFPDLTVFNTEILEKKEKGISAAGFFGLDWSVKNGNFIIE
ncbi:MAG: prolyl oligopeptidase family serine peptidase [Ignavibacteriales bacterium]|nr:prolyl oligopeptidase family serine peptidase [Ignavibacteriales bacterium]